MTTALLGALSQLHIEALIKEVTKELDEELAAENAELTQMMADANQSGDFSKLGNELIECVGEYLPEYGERAHAPLSALLRDVLAECPLARSGLEERLRALYPEVADVLLAPPAESGCSDEHG